MTLLKYTLALGLLLGLTTAGAIAYSTAGPGVEGKKATQPGAPAAKVVRVPTPEDGILVAVGTEIKKSEPAKAGQPWLKVRVGKEVLDLYDKRGFFDAFLTSEPVTGLKRVELENLMQGYQDNLLDNKITRAVPPAR